MEMAVYSRRHVGFFILFFILLGSVSTAVLTTTHSVIRYGVPLLSTGSCTYTNF